MSLYAIRNHFSHLSGLASRLLSEFFKVPKFKILLCPRAFTSEENYIRRIVPRFSRCIALLQWVKLGIFRIFSSSRTYMEKALNSSNSQGLHTERKIQMTNRTSLCLMLRSSMSQSLYTEDEAQKLRITRIKRLFPSPRKEKHVSCPQMRQLGFFNSSKSLQRRIEELKILPSSKTRNFSESHSL